MREWETHEGGEVKCFKMILDPGLRGNDRSV